MTEEQIRIHNQKGLELAMLINRPEDEQPHPSVILLHGFTGYKEEEHTTLLAEQLAKHGIVTIRFDASGFGESEGTLEHDYRLSHYYQDLEEVYNWLTQQSFVHPQGVGVWGHSMGALLSIIWAARHPEVQTICAISPPSHMGDTDLLAPVLDQWEKTGWYEKVSSKYGPIKVPYAFIQDARHYSAFDYTSQLHNQKVLIILGTRDDVVSPEDSRKIFQSLPEPKQLIEIEGMDHAPKKNDIHLQQLTQAALKFFVDHLS
jgi:alpha-beta hydrolase superfamily lysophospholipase